MRWEVPSAETDIIDALDGVASGQMLLLGIADTGSIGSPDETASAEATVTVQQNDPPIVSITAPARLNPGATGNIDITVQDPESHTTTVKIETTGGTIADPNALSTQITAPNTSGPITITATARDQHGAEGVSTHVIVVNSPPSVTITAPSRLEVSRTGDISLAVSDPNSDTVTVNIETSAGSIDNPAALNAVITAPATPQTITITVTATDSEGLQTVETAQIEIVPNQPPTLTITAPSVIEVGKTGKLVAQAGDLTDDPITILWESDHGTIANPTATETTIQVPNTPVEITVTCTVTDDRGAMTVKTATITVRHPNRPPTITLTVPAKAEPGQTVNIEAVVTDLDGDNTDGEWSAPQGSIANPENASTTITLPMETGVVPLTYEAMDDAGAMASKTAYITVGDPKANIFTPAIRVEIEGVDVTDRLTRDAQGRWEPITIGQSLDHPRQSVFRNSLISFSLDNEDGAFDYSSPNNFFVPHSKPAHGRGAEVLIRLGLSKSELIPAVAGQINEVQTTLGNTKARVTIGDLSAKLSHNVVESFGEELTRRITDFDYANVDYDDLDPIFYFPAWGLPIARNSVSVTVHEEGGDVAINIVDVVGTSGVLSNRNAEIDYNRGLIRFELPPADGKDTQITVTWKVDYRYKRPDFLIRELLKRAGIQSELGITDDKAARFGIEQALISHPTSEHFSSHGRPYPQENGVVRWMRRDDSQEIHLFGR